MRNVLSLALLLTPALPATAQSQTDEGGSLTRPRFEPWLSAWRAQNGESWRVVVADTSHSLELLHGGRAEGPLEPRGDAEWFAQARHFLAETAAIHRAAPGTLVDDKVAFLPLGQVNSTDKMTVRLRQEVDGVPVEDGTLNLLFTTRGELLSIHNKAEAGIESLDTTPSIAARAALEQATLIFVRAAGGAPTTVGTPELVIKRLDGQQGHRARLAWRIDLVRKEAGVDPAAWRYWIDAQTAVLLDAKSRVHHFDVQGQVLTMATPGTAPDTASNPPAPVPVPFVRVVSNVGTTFTDADGNFVFPGFTTPIDVTVVYSGPYNDVINDAAAGPSYAQSFPQVPANQANQLLMNATPNPLVTGQANALLGSDAVRDFVRTTMPGDTTLDFQVLSNTSIPDVCNAYYDGVSINFYPTGGGCVNTAYSTVVAHELGHWLNDLYGTFNGFDGMGEGNADVWAMYTFDEPIVGMDFAGPGNHIRDGNNNNPFCGDALPACYGQVHADGMPWMGAAWKVRERLNATHGNALGDMISNMLFLGWMSAYDQSQIKSIIETQWLTLDDDDGNIDNGTPNYVDIDAGFRQQGFPGFDLTWVTFQGVTALASTTDEVGPYVVDATLGAAFNPPVSLATLTYRVGDGPPVTLPMTNVTGNLWRASIPGQTAPSEIEYQLRAEDGLGQFNTFPPRDETLPFRVGVVTIAHATDFEPSSDEGWTVGAPGDNATTGVWERADPLGTGAQPEDDHSSSPGVRCWFTDQGTPGGGLGEADVDGGQTTLLSPIFNMVNMHDPAISYWRWYSNNTGAAPNEDVLVIDISNDGGSTWTNAETVGPDPPEASAGWRYHRFRVADVIAPTASMRMRFIASDLINGSVVEAAIDDFRADDLGPVGCSVPTPYCTAAVNSTGSGATIRTTGSLSVASNAFGLFVSGAPANAVGMVFYGQSQSNTPLADGIRCVRGKVYRMPAVVTDGAGFHNEFLDLGAPPQPLGQIGAGQVWNFQFWYADAGGPGGTGSNLTDAIEVQFCN